MRPIVLSVLLALLPCTSAGAAGPAADPPDNPHGSFRGDCQVCHLPASWTPAKAGPDFDHGKFGEPLEGAHRDVPCLFCHRTLVFEAPAGSECADCHDDVHAGELGTECARCHSTRSFIDRGDMVRAHRATRFPLTGAHSAADCAACHDRTGAFVMSFVNTPVECAACHMAAFAGTVEPNHVTGGFSHDCLGCHTTAGWDQARFDHALTAFPLTGAHRSVDCAQCHVGEQFAGTPSDCFACHQDDYAATADPSHAVLGFGTDCASCHDTNAWAGAPFDHALTSFPLTGAHRGATCTQCHVGGVFAGTSSQCYACHQADYAGATPVHSLPTFSTDCASCHDTNRWDGATFNHSLTAFPLTGAHNAAACDQCHAGGVYGGTPSDCYACHQPDYNGTTNPNHTAAGFGTDCASCHGTDQWEGATFNHAPFFPIDSGAHRGRWTSCTDCHIQPSSYSVFSCFGCHPHSNRSETDNKHSDVGGYSYDSNACYSCHPQGRR